MNEEREEIKRILADIDAALRHLELNRSVLPVEEYEQFKVELEIKKEQLGTVQQSLSG